MGDPHKVKSCPGGLTFLLSKKIPLESHRKIALLTTVADVLTGRTLLSPG